jgi:predicted transcriptional regulator
MQLLKRRPVSASLGPLEIAVMEVLWSRGESNVHEVGQSLARPLAYTTVMTTLDRLYKKGLLKRRKAERAFHYMALVTRRELAQRHAGNFLAEVLGGSESMRELLMSSLVDAAGPQDEAILDELERKIQLKRRELREQRGK